MTMRDLSFFLHLCYRPLDWSWNHFLMPPVECRILQQLRWNLHSVSQKHRQSRYSMLLCSVLTTPLDLFSISAGNWSEDREHSYLSLPLHHLPSVLTTLTVHRRTWRCKERTAELKAALCEQSSVTLPIHGQRLRTSNKAGTGSRSSLDFERQTQAEGACPGFTGAS